MLNITSNQDMQIKIILRYPHMRSRMTTIKKTDHIKDMDKVKLAYTACENVRWHTCFKK